VLLVDKPAGKTSHDVVAIARRVLHTKRIGHTGTLDPFATGLLVLLVGRATRLLPYMTSDRKRYLASIGFGTETSTDDRTGAVVRSASVPDRARIEREIVRLTGAIQQTPPAYSAKQKQGVRAYSAARRGQPLELEDVTVTVFSWEIVEWDGETLIAVIECGGGTYIRALARDIGRFTDSAAHLTALRRLESNGFNVADAQPIDRIMVGQPQLRDMRTVIPTIPVRELGADDVRAILHGGAIAAGDDHAPVVAAIDNSGALVAMLHGDGDRLRPRVVLRDP
jgi:tRNA pseudouridine55 synthase